MEFKDLGLSQATLKAISELGMQTPTTVQADVIPSVLEGKDIFTIAPIRSGKTYSYVLPLTDILASKKGLNILILTADSYQAANVSDSFALFNKYHQTDDNEDDSNVIIATPDLALDLMNEEKVNFANVNILVIDDINLIKKKHQLSSLEKVLKVLPSEKQNIIFTNRRSKETQDLLDQILKTPTEIKVDKTKVDEVETSQTAETIDKAETVKPVFKMREEKIDEKAVELDGKYHTFGSKTPHFILIQGELAHR